MISRLYIRFHLTLLGCLALFAFAVIMLWHRAGGPIEQADANLAVLLQNQLAPASATPAEQQAALATADRFLDGAFHEFAHRYS